MLLTNDFTIEYQLINKLGQVDALSRFINSHCKKPKRQRYCHSGTRSHYSKDLWDHCHYKKLFISTTGWPTVNPVRQLQSFYQCWSSLSGVDGCVLFAKYLVVPLKVKTKVFKQFHFGYQRINHMKALVHSYVYWPNMDKKLEELVHTCSRCQLAAKSTQKNKLWSWQVQECL